MSNSESQSCYHCFVTGKVQGVFYRYHTKEQALALDLCGWVKNLADKRVELLICGEEHKLQQMIKWLHQGPTRAKVDSVTIEQCPWQQFSTFDIIG